MPELPLDFTRTVVLTREYPDVHQFARDLDKHGLLAGVIYECPVPSDTLRLWCRQLRLHGLIATASRGIAQTVDCVVDALTAHLPAPGNHQQLLQAPELSVRTLNAQEAVRFVHDLEPTLGIVVGTSALQPALIREFPPGGVVHVHVGMAPRYRGADGGAWALIEGRPEELVTTIHLVDEGIDTGTPLAYVPVEPHPTLASLARAQRQAGLDWLRGIALAEQPTNWEPPYVPEQRELFYSPGFGHWRTFRRRFRELTGGTTW